MSMKSDPIIRPDKLKLITMKKLTPFLLLAASLCLPSTRLKAQSEDLSSSEEVLSGDSNCDGTVDVMDVITTINYLFGHNPQPFCFENADVNGDGSVSAIDMIETINIILESNFVCGTSTVTDIDGNVYNTVLIGDQCWMKENLKTTHYRNGTRIEYPASNTSAWQNNTTGAYAWYDNETSGKDRYGALYNWHAVNNPHGLCPTGWNVPGDEEWTQLVDYVVARGFPNKWDAQNGAGNALKSCRQANSPLGGACNTAEHPRWIEDTWSGNNHHGADEFGFSGLPGGYRTSVGIFGSIGGSGTWWSSTPADTTQISSDTAWYHYLDCSVGDVYRVNHLKAFGFSVRCVKE